MLDQSYHQLTADQIPDADSIMAFEAKALAKDGIAYAPVPPRHRPPYFHHILGGYAAGYYAYIWSEVLAANTPPRIQDHGRMKPENGDRFREPPPYIGRGAGGEKCCSTVKYQGV